MKNKLIGFFTALLIFGVLTYHTEIVNGIGIVLRSWTNVPTGAFAMQTSVSTSSPNFLENGTGTTTLTIESDKFSALAIYLQTFASTTNTTSPLNIKLQASEDNIQFFDYDPFLVDPASLSALKGGASTTIALASTTQPYSFQPMVKGATSTKVFNVSIIPAHFTRVIFTVATSTPNIPGINYRDGINLWAGIVGQIGNAPQ